MINWFLARVPRLFNGEIIFSTNGDGSIGPCGLEAGALHWCSVLTAKRGVHSSKYKKRAPVAHVTYLLAVQKKLEEKITLLSMDVHPSCVIYRVACSTCISNTVPADKVSWITGRLFTYRVRKYIRSFKKDGH